jgi:flagellar protein FlgJ
MTRSEFITTVAPVAVKVRVDGGPLFPSVSVAQTLLETGGRIPAWNNLVGYKVGSGKRTPYWDGRAVRKGTWEVYDGRTVQTAADFRAYDSIEHCLKDQALLFLNNLGRYRPVVEAPDPESQARALRACGYATDPAYAEKIMAIRSAYKLEKYDEEARKAMEALKEMQEKVATLQREVEALRKRDSMDSVPSWAQAAVDAAVRAKLIDPAAGGSFDFYRFLTVMHRAGLIPKEAK